ncbi:hypothetical protein ACFOHT_04780 [Massilia oculi]|uniref:hypothetical protein n=1 Tax=Massilia oculi TaxID=945844 RepID=UPI0013B3E5E9|nr:hypothetical protein [Massilia oculi]
MTTHQDTRATSRPTAQEMALMAARAQRIAEYRAQLELIVARGLAREIAEAQR